MNGKSIFVISMEVKNMNEHITGAIWGAVLGDVIGAPL